MSLVQSKHAYCMFVLSSVATIAYWLKVIWNSCLLTTAPFSLC